MRRKQKPTYSAVLTKDSDANKYANAPGLGYLMDGIELSEKKNTKQSSLAKANVALQDFNPGTWLFELDPVEGQNGLDR